MMTNATHGCRASPAAPAGETGFGAALGVRPRWPAQPAVQVADHVDRHAPPQPRPRRRQQAEQHAGHGRVDAGLQERQPDARPDDDVDGDAADPEPAASARPGRARRRPAPGPAGTMSVL